LVKYVEDLPDTSVRECIVRAESLADIEAALDPLVMRSTFD